ncbi:MAG: transcription termination factor NusA [Phototrophicaceae bacterium]
MKNEFELAFNEIAELRALPQDTILEALQTALVSAYRRDTNASSAQRVEASIDPATGRQRIFVEKEVVDEVMHPTTEVDLETARFYEPECQLGDTVMVQVEGSIKKFGRIAAQTAKQVILQKIREAERKALYDEFSEKEGDIVNGTVQSVTQNVVTISLGRAEAIMPRAQQIPGEYYRPHDKVRVYVLEVKPANRGPQIIVSRSHRNVLRRLLEFEVPEIYNGQIEIKNIAREAGYRSKVAVAALQDGIDPVGACVGMRGMRIQNIVKELHDEKIDVIEWSSQQEVFIEKALSPARVTGVYLDDDPDSGRTAVVIVRDDQLSLAIGREGQNARLAAKLTGWRIDIKSVSEAVNDALSRLDEPPLTDIAIEHADLVAEVGLIIEKRDAKRVITAEEFRVLDQFADIVERRVQKARDEARAARLAEINAVKATLPQAAFLIPVDQLDLPDHIIESLQPLENVGEIMLRFLIDENRLRRLLGKDADAVLPRVQEALDELMFDEQAAAAIAEAVMAEATAEAELVEEEEVLEEADITPVEETENVVQSTAGETPEPAAAEEAYDVEPAADVTPASAFPEQPVEEAEQAPPRPREESDFAELVDFDIDDDDDDLDDEGDEAGRGKGKKKRKKERQKRRQLIFDEETGQTYSKRRRKGGRKADSWDDF